MTRHLPHQLRTLATLATVAGLTIHLAATAGAQRQNAVPRSADAATIAHVLNRIGFGAAPGDVARVQAMGLTAYIEQQLHPERIADPDLDARLASFTTLTMSTGELASEYYQPALEMRRAQQQREAQAARQAPPAGAGTSMTMTPPPQDPAPTPEQRQLQARQATVMNELMQAKMLRAVMSDAQLEEVLVDFWFNHFNVFVGKGQVRQYLTSYERDAIRPYVLGSFRDMLGATAHHPAMLFYLDNFQSQAPQGAETMAQVELRGRQGRPGVLVDPRRPGQTRPGQVRPGQVRPGQNRPGQVGQGQPQMRPGAPNPQPQRPARGLNENYARELMELHTLGVDGGYTQQDVISVARILTGWTIDRPQAGGDFIFRPATHDAGEKVALGVKFPAGKGEEEGERLLDLLAAHPKTARHIAYKLAQRFVADEPPAELVDRAAKVFLDTKGDLRQVTRAIITSAEFFAEDHRAAKVKTPFEFVVSAARVTGATVVNPQPMVQALRDLGMPLYGCQPPTGYSMTADAWVNTGALLNRMNFALQLVSGGVPMRGDAPQTRPDGQVRPNAPVRPNQQPRPNRQGLQNRAALQARMPIQVNVAAMAPDMSDATREALVVSILGGQASDATRATMARAGSPEQLIALTLGSPEFQKR